MDSASAAERVCMVMQIPPTDIKAENRINLSMEESILTRLQQPFDSSIAPIRMHCTTSGKSHKNHLLKKEIKIRNKITHPQTVAMAFMEWLSAEVRENV